MKGVKLYFVGRPGSVRTVWLSSNPISIGTEVGDVELERPCSQATLLTQPVRAVTVTELVGVSILDTGS